jgi:hypothetical protein
MFIKRIWIGQDLSTFLCIHVLEELRHDSEVLKIV